MSLTTGSSLVFGAGWEAVRRPPATQDPWHLRVDSSGPLIATPAKDKL